FLTNVTYSDFGDLKMGKHGPDEYLRPEYVSTVNGQDQVIANSDPRIQKPTGYNQLNVLQKVKFKPNEKIDYLAGIYFSTTSDYPRYDRLIRYRGDQLRSAEWYYGPQKWFMGNLHITRKSDRVLFDQVRFTNAYQHFEESRNDRDFSDVYKYNTSEKIHAFSSNLA